MHSGHLPVVLNYGLAFRRLDFNKDTGMREYLIKNYRAIPQGQNVAKQLLVVYVDSIMQEPIAELAVDAQTARFAVEDGASVTLISRWVEKAEPNANFADSDPVCFIADETAIEIATPLGIITYVSETDELPTSGEQVDADAPVIHDHTVVDTTEASTTAEPTTAEATTVRATTPARTTAARTTAERTTASSATSEEPTTTAE